MAQDRIAEIIRAGVEMEREGQRIYRDAAAKSKHPFAGKMFESLAKDEERHEQWFLTLSAKRGISPAPLAKLDPDGFLKQIRAVFKGLRKQIDGLKPAADDIQVIDLALGLEEKSYRLYLEASEAATSPDERAVLAFVAREENNHWRILDDAKLYLTDPVKWNIKEESPLIDGG